MCGRLNLTDSEEVIALLSSLGFDTRNLSPRVLEPRYNLAPTDTLLVAGVDQGGRFVRPMTWWLTPSWAPAISRRYAMFNARAETLEQSRAFKSPFRYRRALVPASGFIEWRQRNGIKQPLYVTPPAGPCFFAALWDVWEKEGHLESCAIITCEASASFRPVHDRMPVILAPREFDSWLADSATVDDLQQLLVPRQLTGWRILPLQSTINDSRRKEREVFAVAGEEELLA